MSKLIDEITESHITLSTLEAFFYFGVASLAWGLVIYGMIAVIVTAP